MNISSLKKTIVPFLFLFLLSIQTRASVFNVVNLKTNNLTSPLGIDMTPFFSWQITSDARGQSQSAYQIQVASTQALLDANTADIWNSGKIISSASNNILYGGKPLLSKTDYYWKVRIWNQNDEQSSLSAVDRFGMAMLQTSDWKAKWITIKKNNRVYPHVDIIFDKPLMARYIRLNVTKIGIPVDESNLWRLQLAEMQVFGPLDTLNLAYKCQASVNNEYVAGSWKASNLTDGIVTSTSTSSGASSEAYASGTLTTPVYIQLDLGHETLVNKVVLYPRNDISSKANKTLVGSFPQDFSIQAGITGLKDYTICKSIVNQSTPTLYTANLSLPMFGKNFKIKKEIKSAKIYACGLGLFDLKVNGKAVTKNVMEPGETNYSATALYATYDVKHLLVIGQNTLISTLGNAQYYNPSGTGRYQKLSKVYGPLKFIGQLEIVYTDETKQTIITDESWKSAQSPTTYSSWYGGEDYDSRLKQANIDQKGFVLPTSWANVSLCTEIPDKLKAQFYQPTKVMETWNAVKISNPATGIYVVDFGRNFAGQFEFSMKAPTGTSVQFWPSELLDSLGRINQSDTGTPVFDTYTFNGNTSAETWGPTFVYHGFRYLELRGLTSAPTADMFKAKLIRSGLDKIGKFSTSNTLLNKIDLILTRSIEANLYNTFTDCPGREKLGWLEVPSLLYNSVTPSYDVSTWMTKITMDTKDAQLPNGMVPTTAPEHTIFGGPFRYDPTWASAAIRVPWQNYITYGNFDQLKNAYPTMTKLMDYFVTRASGYLLNYGLGEWGAIDKSTTVGFTVSCTYYKLATDMSQAAYVLGEKADAANYETLAANIKNAINTAYYKSANGWYDNGSQASNAMAIYYGIVPDNKKAIVLQSLVTKVQNAGYHLSTGEIALKPLFYSLAQNGYNDVVYTMATQTTQPSYGYFVQNGCTTTPEYWDLSCSQNHCMMGHIESWFYEYLGGIINQDIAYFKFNIEPYYAPGLDSVHVETSSLYGKIRSIWKRNSDHTISQLVEVPPNSTATIRLQTDNLNSVTESGMSLEDGNGINAFQIKNGKVEIEVGSGVYNFNFKLEDPLQPMN